MLTTLLFFSSCTKEQKAEPFHNPQLETRGGCPDVPIVGPGCSEYFRGPDTFIIDGCAHIALSYRVIECPGGFTVDNLIWTRDTSSACKALELSWIAQGLGAATLLYEQTVKQLTLNIQNKLMQSFHIQNKYRCTNAGTNPCSNLTYAVGFHMAGCYNLCAYEETNEEDITLWYLYESQCGDGFCKRNTPFCIKNDGTVCYGTPIVTSAGDCEPVTIDCRAESAAQAGPCRQPCRKL